MLDKPVAGRIFFEQVIRDNLDIGRPDQVVLIFDRRLMRRGKRPTPGRFRTRVITEGVTPSLHVDYKHTRIKQYHKEGRALRTETTVNDTTDFGIGKRLTNLPALREIGTHANRRLLRVQSLGHDPITGADALDTITGALTTGPAPACPDCGWPSGVPTPCFRRCSRLVARPTGSPTAICARSPAELRGLKPGAVTAGQTTYDLRRLKTRGLIARIPHSHRYTVTDHGLHTARFLTCVHDRFLPTGLAQLADHTPSPLRAASLAYNDALENLSRTVGLAS